jgi:hypothetical protein
VIAVWALLLASAQAQTGAEATPEGVQAALEDAVVAIGAAESVDRQDEMVVNNFHVQVFDLDEGAAPRTVELDTELNRIDTPSDLHLFPAPGALIATPGNDERPWMVLGLS